MDSLRKNITEYVVVVISEFAKKFRLTIVQSYQYLSIHKGISFLESNYDIAHTLPMEDVVNDLATYCRRNGGSIA